MLATFSRTPPLLLDPRPSAPCMPSNPATIIVKNRVLTTDIAESIRNSFRGDILRDFTIKKETKINPSWSASTWDLIDFSSRHSAFKQERPATQRRLIKLQNRWLPVGTRTYDKGTTKHGI